jgi:hypothetical protein
MGAIYVGARSMYAIHIPPDKKDVIQAAGETFVRFIKNNEGRVRSSAYLFGFVNGKNRNVTSSNDITAEEEMRLMKKALNSPNTTLYRINKHLGPQSGGFSADSVVIMVDRVHASAYYPSGCAIYYKRNADITWVDGGEPATGQYKPRPDYIPAKIPSDLFGQWRRATTENCSVTTI